MRWGWSIFRPRAQATVPAPTAGNADLAMETAALALANAGMQRARAQGRDPAGVPTGRATRLTAGLTIEALASYLDDFYEGRYRSVAMLWDVQENGDGICAAVKDKRVAKVVAESTGYTVEPTDDSAAAAKQAEFVRTLIDGLRAEHALRPAEHGGLRKGIEFLCDAIGKQFAFAAKVWEGSGDSLRLKLRYVPLWHFRLETDGTFRYCPNPDSTLSESTVVEAQWVIAARRRAVMESVSVAALLRRLPVQQVARILEKFGIPNVYGSTTAPPGSPGWTAVYNALAGFISDMPALFSEGTKVDSVKPDYGASPLFQPFYENLRTEIVVNWVGGELGTVAKSGSGTLAGGAQAADLDDIIRDDCDWLSEIVQEQIVRDAIARRFGSAAPVLVKFSMRKPDPRDDETDLEVLNGVVALGGRVPLSHLYDRFDLPEAAEGETAICGVSTAPAEDEEPPPEDEEVPEEDRAQARAQAAAGKGGRKALAVKVPELRVPEAWGAPVREVLAEMERRAADPSISDAELLAWLREQTAALPALAEAMDVDGLAAGIEAGLSAAVDGVAAAAGGGGRAHAYDPGQARDDHGRWSDGGAGMKSDFDTAGGFRRFTTGMKTVESVDKKTGKTTQREVPVYEFRLPDGTTPSPEMQERIDHMARIRDPKAQAVYINPDASAKLQASVLNAGGKWQPVYNAEFESGNQAENFSRLKGFDTDLGPMRLRAGTDAEAGVAEAVCMRVMDRTCIRVGSPGDTDHVGLTSLRAEHVAVEGDRVTLDFTGKAGVAWHREVRDKAVAEYVRGRLESGGEGPVFGTSAARYNDYLQSIRPAGSPEYSAKDFRTHHATATARRRLSVNIGSRNVGSLSLGERRSLMKDACDFAARRIGDTPAMAKKRYIDPAVWGMLGPDIE